MLGNIVVPVFHAYLVCPIWLPGKGSNALCPDVIHTHAHTILNSLFRRWQLLREEQRGCVSVHRLSHNSKTVMYWSRCDIFTLSISCKTWHGLIVSGKVTSKGSAAGSRTLPRHGLKAGTSSVTNNSSMMRSTSMGMLNQVTDQCLTQLQHI